MCEKPIFKRVLFVILLQLLAVNSFCVDLDKKQLIKLNADAELLMKNEPDEAIMKLKVILDNTTSTDENKDMRAKALKTMGNIHYFKQNLRQANEYYEQALTLFRELNDTDGIAAILNNTGLIYERQGDFSKALNRYQEASVLMSKSEESKNSLSIVLSNIGNIYYTLGRFDLALNFLSQALKNSESLNDTSEMAPIYNNIGNIYLSLKEYKTAIDYYRKAEKIHVMFDHKRELSIVYNNIGESYLNLNDINNALKYNKLSLEIANNTKDNEGVISSYVNIGRIYTKIDEYDQALSNYKEALRLSNLHQSDKMLQSTIFKGIGEVKILQNDFDEAVIQYKEALALVEKTGSEVLKQEIYAGLSKAWEAKGNYQKSLEYLKLHQLLLDSIYDQENVDRLNMIRVSFELEQTERDNQLLRQQNIYSQLALNRQRTIHYLFVVITAIILISLIFLFLMYHSKKKKNELLAERNQQILKQKEELDKLYLEQFKLNEIKTKFFSIVAHDLKSPFQSLLGFTELLSMEYDQFTDEQRLDAINNMYKVTSDTYKLIENLLEWGRIQTGNANVSMKYINLEELVNSIMPIFELPLKNKNLTITLDIPSNLIAHADPNMMSAILRNLISNAVKFSNPGSIVQIKGIATADSTKLSITDNGIGISAEVIEKLFTFDPKIRRVGTKGETGTGMGLGLCMEFMQLNYGMIKVHSTPGKGSTFTMIMQPGKVTTPELV